MFLVNPKTGVPEEMSESDHDDKASKWSRSSEHKPSREKSSGFGQGGRRGFSSAKTKKDDFIPEITRTSDKKKKHKPRVFAKKGGGAGQAEDPGVITRSSDSGPSGMFGAPRAKPPYSSKSYAVYLLSKREYTEKMLRDRIVRRGYSAEEAEEALAFVIAKKYQSDERFASLKASSLQRRVGNARVVMTLRDKGIAVELAKAQIEGLGPEEERAIQAVSKYRSKVGQEGLTDKLRVKIYRFLASRGFSSGSVKAAMRSLSLNYVDDDFDPSEPDEVSL